MKRFFYGLMLFSAALAIASCDEKDIPNIPGEIIDNAVPVVLSYTLNVNEGDMSATKASNPEIFQMFYDQMVNRNLTETSFELKFTELTTGKSVTFNGDWNNNNHIMLLTGTYQVTGTSKAEGDNVQEKCSLAFDEIIQVTASTSSVVLHATYDCFLIIVSDETVSNIRNDNGNWYEHDFFKYDRYFYVFVNTTLYEPSRRDYAQFAGQHIDGTGFTCKTGNMVFNKGKYYIISNVALYYDLPYMDDGSGSGSVVEEDAIVDLGLSVKWATRNVGARASCEEVGYRFAWGEVTPDKEWYNWDNYQWCYGFDGYYDYSITITKYITNGQVLTLEDSDDAARHHWGRPWRMPTMDEYRELIDNCTWMDDTVNGVDGRRGIGPNGNSIFFPYNGQSDENGLHDQDYMVQVWCSQAYEDIWAVFFRTGRGWEGADLCSNHRHDGHCVRAVCD